MVAGVGDVVVEGGAEGDALVWGAGAGAGAGGVLCDVAWSVCRRVGALRE